MITKRNKRIIVLCSVLVLILIAGAGIFFANKLDNRFTFPLNENGEVIALNYADNFKRNKEGAKIVSITEFEKGFLGAYYGYVYYFHQDEKYDIPVPEGYYSMNAVRFDGEDENKIWCPTGLYYDERSSLLYVANYHGHNVLVCSWKPADNSIELSVEKEIAYDGMQSPENVYVNNSLAAVADYDGNALWVFGDDGELRWKKEIGLAHGVTISDDAIYVTSLSDRAIYKYSFDGDLLCQVGKRAYEGVDSFMWPTSLDNNNEQIIVSDAHTGRIYLYDEDLNYISSIGGIGPSDNALNFPYCAVIIEDFLYIGDVFNERIVVLNSNGEISNIYGGEINNIDLGIMAHSYDGIPYSYGELLEVDSEFFNPLIERKVLSGYDGLIFYNSNTDHFKINSFNYSSNSGGTITPTIEQLYITWVKELNYEGKKYFVIGGPENSWQYYVYNETDDIFIICFGVENLQVWYVDGTWYSQIDVDSCFNRIIDEVKEPSENYLKLIENGGDKRDAYATSFLSYYNKIYQQQLSQPMSEDILYSWINSFFSTEGGSDFWEAYTTDEEQLYINTQEYYEKMQLNANLCELLFVKMFGYYEVK